MIPYVVEVDVIYGLKALALGQSNRGSARMPVSHGCDGYDASGGFAKTTDVSI
jgi:hypothetical protein